MSSFEDYQAPKNKGRGYSPLPLIALTAGNVPFGRDAPRSVNNSLAHCSPEVSTPQPPAVVSYQPMDFQFFARYSAVRHASACTVSVGLRAPLVPISRRSQDAEVRRVVREAPSVDDVRFRDYRPCACRRMHACSDPGTDGGWRMTSIAPAARNHSSIFFCA